MKIHHLCNEKPLSVIYSIYHVARFTSVQCIDFVAEETHLTFTKRRHLDAFQCQSIFSCLNISLASSDFHHFHKSKQNIMDELKLFYYDIHSSSLLKGTFYSVYFELRTLNGSCQFSASLLNHIQQNDKSLLKLLFSFNWCFTH